MMLLALLASFAAADTTDSYTWDIALNGNVVGHRTLDVQTIDDPTDPRRVLRVWTDINASLMGRQATFQQRMTAVAGSGPAAFHASVDQNGSVAEYQARQDGYGWTLTSVEPRGVRSEDLPANSVDLSTADLLDPGSRVPIWTFTEARVLTAEDGLIWQTPVTRLGADGIVIDGQTVLAEGYEIEPPAGKMQLWYSADGVLVKYAWRWMGVRAEAVLQDPPPQTLDTTPAIDDGPVVTETAL